MSALFVPLFHIVIAVDPTYAELVAAAGDIITDSPVTVVLFAIGVAGVFIRVVRGLRKLVS